MALLPPKSPNLLVPPSVYDRRAQEQANNALRIYFNQLDNTCQTLITNVAVSGTVSSVAQSFTGGLISVAGSPITTSGTLALTVAGTSGGIPYFSSASTWATSAALTQYGVVYGGGAGATPVATAAGTTGQILTATTSGAPTWANPATSGTVTSVGFTGGIISVATPTTTPAFTVAGTSGGIPYFSSASTWATSAALTQYGVVYGGGAGATPVATAAGTTGQILTATTGGAPTWASPSGTVTSIIRTVYTNVTGTAIAGGATLLNIGYVTQTQANSRFKITASLFVLNNTASTTELYLYFEKKIPPALGFTHFAECELKLSASEYGTLTYIGYTDSITGTPGSYLQVGFSASGGTTVSCVVPTSGSGCSISLEEVFV